MNEWIEALEKEYPYARRCTFCGSDPANPTWEQLQQLLGCNNCLLDIQAKGQWSSDGMGFLAALYKQSQDDVRWEKVIIPWLAKGGME